MAVGNKRIETIKAKYGVDNEGKSIFHKRAGAKGGKAGGKNVTSFGNLTPDRQREISSRGGLAAAKNRRTKKKRLLDR